MSLITIKDLAKKDVKDFIKLQQKAYPTAYQGTTEEVEKMEEVILGFMEKPDLRYVGAYQGEDLIGGLVHIVFEQNLHGTMVSTHGIGSVAVSLLHKKQGVAKNLILSSLQYARDQKADLFTLYPFDPSFYRSFGFGYGSPLYHYQIPPRYFRSFEEGTQNLTYEVTPEEVKAFYDAWVENNHGSKKKTNYDMRFYNKANLLGYKEDGKLMGFLCFKQEKLTPGHFLDQRLYVHEMVYEEPAALRAFSTFFHRQGDQINYIDLHTFDQEIVYALTNLTYQDDEHILPFVSHKVAELGLGLMWQVLQPEKIAKHLLKELPYKVHISLRRPRQENLSFSAGQDKKGELSLALDLQEFSSWMAGVISLRHLYRLSLLTCSQADLLPIIDHQLNFNKPINHARF